MCLNNLFSSNVNCTWLLFIIVLVLLFSDDNCGNNDCASMTNSGCGCGCGC